MKALGVLLQLDLQIDDLVTWICRRQKGLLYKVSVRNKWAFSFADSYEGSLLPIEGPSTLPNSSSELSFRGPQKSIVLVDTLENTATCLRTVGDLVEAINVNRAATSFVKRYMNPITLYKGRYEFHYAKEFK